MQGILELVETVKDLSKDPSVDNVTSMLRNLGDAVKQIAQMFTDDENILKILTGCDKVLDGAADIVDAAVAIHTAQ